MSKVQPQPWLVHIHCEVRGFRVALKLTQHSALWVEGNPLGQSSNVVIAVFTFYQPVGLIMVKEGSCGQKDGAVLYMKPHLAFMTQHLSVLTSCYGSIYWNKRRTNRSRTHLFICWSCVAHYDLRKCVCIFFKYRFAFI